MLADQTHRGWPDQDLSLFNGRTRSARLFAKRGITVRTRRLYPSCNSQKRTGPSNKRAGFFACIEDNELYRRLTLLSPDHIQSDSRNEDRAFHNILHKITDVEQ